MRYIFDAKTKAGGAEQAAIWVGIILKLTRLILRTVAILLFAVGIVALMGATFTSFETPPQVRQTDDDDDEEEEEEEGDQWCIPIHLLYLYYRYL